MNYLHTANIDAWLKSAIVFSSPMPVRKDS